MKVVFLTSINATVYCMSDNTRPASLNISFDKNLGNNRT